MIPPLAKLPETGADEQEGDANQRSQPGNQGRDTKRLASFQQRADWHIVQAGNWDNISKETAEPGAVDGKWVLCRLGAAVGDGIHDFQRFHRPEAEGGLQDKEAIEGTHPAEDRSEEEKDLGEGPDNTQLSRGPDKDGYSLDYASCSQKLEILTGYLQQCATGAQEQTVEVTGFYHSGEHIEATPEHLRESKGDIYHAIE